MVVETAAKESRAMDFTPNWTYLPVCTLAFTNVSRYSLKESIQLASAAGKKCIEKINTCTNKMHEQTFEIRIDKSKSGEETEFPNNPSFQLLFTTCI